MVKKPQAGKFPKNVTCSIMKDGKEIGKIEMIAKRWRTFASSRICGDIIITINRDTYFASVMNDLHVYNGQKKANFDVCHVPISSEDGLPCGEACHRFRMKVSE